MLEPRRPRAAFGNLEEFTISATTGLSAASACWNAFVQAFRQACAAIASLKRASAHVALRLAAFGGAEGLPPARRPESGYAERD
jgi:hypothetical protein